MKIDLLIFDLDGVLVDSREIHYLALNEALAEVGDHYQITPKEHLTRYDGLSTKKKLAMLSQDKGLPENLHQKIWQRKQELTLDVIMREVKPNPKITKLFQQLKIDNIIIYVCSNSIRKTIESVLHSMQLDSFVTKIISNEDVLSPKPHPEMYWQAMTEQKVLPTNTMIVEDSYVGRTAALSSGAKLCAVKDPTELSVQRIYNEMQKPHFSKKWEDKKLNVLIPMAGAGSRFAKVGYTFPKPLIEVDGQPMIKVAVDNLNVDAHFIFIVQKKHAQEYHLHSLLNVIAPGCDIIISEGLTEGACCSTLLAEKYIDNENPLLIANSDQFIEWESGQFFHTVNAPNIDGSILTFENTHPKWSYVRLDDHGNVVDLREKEVISNMATVGIYYWSHGCDYVKYAKQMIAKNIRVNNEFYVAPVYNEAIADGKYIKAYNIDKMWGLGTPEDLQHFLHHYPLKQ